MNRAAAIRAQIVEEQATKKGRQCKRDVTALNFCLISHPLNNLLVKTEKFPRNVTSFWSISLMVSRNDAHT